MRQGQENGRGSAAGPPANAERAEQASEAATLLTAGQVAARWQVPKSQVYRLARDGRVPVVRLGRYMRFRVEALGEWERGGGASDE